MRAWLIEGDRLVATERPDIVPSDDQVAVDVEGAVVARPRSPDRIGGPAAVGTVSAAGEAARHLVGVRVLVAERSPCGECDLCRRGAAPVCPRGEILGETTDGALAARVAVRARWVCPLVDGLTIDGAGAAATAGPLLEAYAMYARTGVAPGEPVIIAGDGAAARALFWIAISRGGKPIAVTADDDWSGVVRERGGATVAPGPELLDRTRAAAAGAGLGERPWRLFDADGSDAGRAAALALASPGATLTLARTRGAAPVDLERLVDLAVTVIAVPGAHPDLLTEAAALVTRGELPLADLIDLRPVDELALPGDATRVPVADLAAS